jgi:Druantia protein DruA
MNESALATDVRALLLAAHRTESPSKIEARALLVTRKQENLRQHFESLHRVEGRAIALMKRVDYSSIDPVLAVVSPRDNPLWHFYRHVLSSAPYDGQPGRSMLFFVFDRNSGGVMGICELSSDLDSLHPRDTYIGWSRVEKYRKRRMHSIANMTTCVVVQPFGALTGGKCAAAMIVSSDVASLWLRKYGEPLLAVSTTSLFGKSSQYNRLPMFRFLGLTPGTGVATISKREYALIRRFLHESGEAYGLAGYGGTTGGGKMANVHKAAYALGITRPSSAMPKGVYFAEFGEGVRAYLRAETEHVEVSVPSMRERAQWWLDRWYAMRWPKVHEQVESFDFLTYSLAEQMKQP